MKILHKAKAKDSDKYIVSESTIVTKDGRLYLREMKHNSWIQCDMKTRSLNINNGKVIIKNSEG